MKISKKQVTRGHNIFTDGWAGASNPHPHQVPHSHTQYTSKTLIFALLTRVHGPTDQQMDEDLKLRVRN